MTPPETRGVDRAGVLLRVILVAVLAPAVALFARSMGYYETLDRYVAPILAPTFSWSPFPFAPTFIATLAGTLYVAAAFSKRPAAAALTLTVGAVAWLGIIHTRLAWHTLLAADVGLVTGRSAHPLALVATAGLLAAAVGILYAESVVATRRAMRARELPDDEVAEATGALVSGAARTLLVGVPTGILLAILLLSGLVPALEGRADALPFNPVLALFVLGLAFTGVLLLLARGRGVDGQAPRLFAPPPRRPDDPPE